MTRQPAFPDIAVGGLRLCVVLVLASSAIGQTPVDLGRLRPRLTRNLALAGGEKHRFQVAVDSGQFFSLVVEKKGIDLTLAVLDPQGREVSSFSSPNGAYGFEYVSAIADHAGTYLVEVTAKGGLRGQYTITLRAVRPPAGEDRLQLRAQTLFRAAVDADRAGDEAGLRRALQSYTEAEALFEQVNEPYRKALILHRLGLAYEGLHEPGKALEFYNRALSVRRTIRDRSGEAATLNNIGGLHLARGDKPQALEFFSQSLKIRRGLQDRGGQAASLFNMAKAAGNPQALEFYNQALENFRLAGDRPREALCLELIGDVTWEDLGDKRKAVESYIQALGVYRALGNRFREAIMLTNLGLGYSDLGQGRKALEVYNQALTIYRESSERANEAILLNNMGTVHSTLSEPQKALEFFGQALQIRVALGDRQGQAVSLDSMGGAYSALGEKQKALDVLNEALAIGRIEGPRTVEANILSDMGTVYNDLGEPAKTLECFNQALSIRRAAGDRLGQAGTLGNIGVLYARLGDKRKALEFYSQALPIKRASGDRRGTANTLNNMAGVYSELGDNQKALQLYNEVIAILHAVGDRTGEADALCNSGKAYSSLGENRKALELCTQALSIERAQGARPSEAYSLSGIGEIYSDLGEHGKALDFYNQALAIYHAVGDRRAEASTLNDIGALYSLLGDKEKALEIYTQCLSLYRAVGDHWDEARILVNLGNTYSALADRTKALQFYDQAMARFQAGGDRYGEAELLDRMGMVYDDLGQKEKALDLYTQALALRRAVGDRGGEARTLTNTAVVYDELGQKRQALELNQQALAIFRSVGNREGEAGTLNNLQVLFAGSQPDLAIFFGKQAVNVLQTLRRDIRGLQDSLRHSYEKSIEAYCRNLAGLLVERQRFGEAEEVLALLKNKEAGDFVQRDSVADQLRSATLLDSEKAALARYQQVIGQVVVLGQKKAALLAKAENDGLNDAERAQSDQLDSDLGAANLVLRRFFDEQEKSFAAKSDATSRIKEFREAESIQGRLAELGSDVVAIYTLVVHDRYIAMLITSGARKAFTSNVKETELNSKIFEFRKRLQDPASDPLPLAQELYRIVFPEGLRADLESMQATTIMWSVDGPLRYIPIAALHDGHDYMVQRFRNSLITPASMDNLKETPQARWQGVGYGVSKAQAGFTPLDSVPAELRSIFRPKGSQQGIDTAPLQGTVRLDADFTREAFQHDLLQLSHRVVHIATHFDSHPTADNSHLLLGDGEWSLQEISAKTRLFNGVDLLTLSACSTAFTNRSEDGKEVDSLATVAQQLGAKSVIASLWSVNDEATARLMQTMYRLRQQNPPMAKNESLRKAQEQMLSGTLRAGGNHGPDDRGPASDHADPPAANHDWRHPYFWAPFILIGNWR